MVMKSYLIITIFFLVFSISVAQDDQQPPDAILRPYIFYETNQYTCKFIAPEHWKFDLNNAQLDDYSAALLPDTNEYYDSGIIIFIWIFNGRQYTYDQFVSYDSAAYIKENPEIKFMRTDSVLTKTDQWVTYFETAEPGGKYELAAVGYIPAGNEIIVYEMNITNRLFFSEAQFAIRDALEGFELVLKKD